MSMLYAAPTGVLSSHLAITRDQERVATVRFNWLAETAQVIVGETTYDLRQRALGLCAYVLEHDGKAVARAQRRKTLFAHSFAVDCAGRRYRIEPRAGSQRRFVVREGAQHIGYIEPTKPFSQTVKACLPACLPLAVQAFMIAVAVRLWTKQ